ncbi:L,D-transpeptidase [Actinomadura atramentaria]|uniref:L,D-transpeptidase n=1 Tax=Actinomadura atramentaria TaxID=1990 RepID=UPI0003AA8473|nr:Ig-like domain-containing protein [Actinomadura atramentaria]
MLRGRTAVAGAALAAGVVLGAAGCSSGGDGAGGGSAKAAEAPPPEIVPATGTQGVAPDQPVTVRAKSGRLTEVTVADAKGDKAAGALSADGRTWRTTWGLKPSTAYTVTAKGDADGRAVTATSSFTTLKPRKKLESGMSPLDGEKVGVGMPVQLLLSQPVATKEARAAVERSLEVRMSTPVEGAWNWISDREVDFRPRDYWPTGQKVRVVAHLAGVKVGDGVYGMKDRTLDFSVGERHITKVNANTHRATVTSGGSVVRTMKVSLGKPGDDSYSGTMIAQEKTPHMVMDSATTGDPGAYRTPTDWNVRLTYSGTFVHSAPWSVGSQGNANVSHGCVNAAPADAKWFYEFTNRGDIVQISGTTRKLRFGNGPTPWAKSWQDWLAGSALGKSVTGAKL